jgi:glutamyl-tRNA reductase
MNSRKLAAEQAEEIIDTQVDYFLAWLRAQSAQSTIRDYRAQAEQARDEVLQKAIVSLKNGVSAEEAMNRLAHSLTNKLIHTPSTQIRTAAENERYDLITAAREIFKLPEANNN